MSALPVGVERVVGQPTHERALTDAVEAGASRLLPPGPGRALYTLTEVAGPIGRPDVLLLVASPRSLESALRHCPRLHNYTEAEVLAGAMSGRPSRHSRRHDQAVRVRLTAAGWFDYGGFQTRLNLVHRSLLIEAKVADWKGGVLQLVRERGLAEHAALAVPDEVHRRVDRGLLRRQRLGLIRISDSQAAWRVRPSSRSIELTSRLWLGELLLRSAEQR